MENKGKNIKLLVFSVPAWNSRVGSNTWSALVEQYGSKNVANICIREEHPDNPACSQYFVISENRVLKSVVQRHIKTGREVKPSAGTTLSNEDLSAHNKRYGKMKKHRRYSLLMAREIVWTLGKWRSDELDAFLDSFKPDIILYSMEGYIHLNRIICYCVERTGVASLGYFWDDNFTYKQSKKIGYRIYRFFQRKSLKKLAKVTDAFFAISDMTKREADAFFGVDCRILTKPLNAVSQVEHSKMSKPIKILYTGNLLIGRDRSLLRVVRAIRDYCPEDFIVDVYTQTELSAAIHSELECTVCRIHRPIPQSEVLEKQREADLLLFLEDIDGPDAYTARLSFSTKITDYLSSGKAILAVGCGETAPMQYFVDNDAALIASSDKEIVQAFLEISAMPELLVEYAEKARACGIKNHSKEKVLGIFNDTIHEVLENKERK